jgi:hypothetical protein
MLAYFRRSVQESRRQGGCALNFLELSYVRTKPRVVVLSGTKNSSSRIPVNERALSGAPFAPVFGVNGKISARVVVRDPCVNQKVQTVSLLNQPRFDTFHKPFKIERVFPVASAGCCWRLIQCRSGGIGRRAWFRSMYSQGCGGSSPFFGTMCYYFL